MNEQAAIVQPADVPNIAPLPSLNIQQNIQPPSIPNNPSYNTLSYNTPSYVESYPESNTKSKFDIKKYKLPIIIGLGIVILGLFLIIWLVVYKKDGTWSDWGECLKDPNNENQYIQTKTYQKAEWGGTDLSQAVQSTPPTQICGADGSYTPWAASGKCQVSSTDNTELKCGPGRVKNIRSYKPKIGNGVDISPENRVLAEWVDCNNRDCKPVDGTYSDWINGECQVSQTDPKPITCGSGVMTQKRNYIPAIDYGNDIPKNMQVLSRWAACNLPACPKKTDATCSPWVDDPKGCACVPNTNAASVYQIKQTRIYSPPLNGGVDNTGDCAINTERYVLCDSNLPTSSDDPTLLFPNGTPGGICPSKAVYVDFPKVVDANCTPAKGPGRTAKLMATYTFPVGNNNNHDPKISNNYKSTDLDIIANLQSTQQPLTITNILDNSKVTWQRTNNKYPQTYTLTKSFPCSDIPYYTESQLNDIWAEYTKCNGPLDIRVWQDVGKKVSDVQLLKDSIDIQKIFDPYSKSTIISSLTTSDVKRFDYCYQTPKKYLIITENDKYPITNSLYSGLIFNKPSKGNLILMQNSIEYPYFQFRFQSDGNIIYSYHTDKDNSTAIWTSGTYGANPAMTLAMQFDGNLVAYDTNGKPIWNSQSFNNPGIYLYMTPFGSLVWNNPDKSYKQSYIDPYEVKISGITYKIFNSLNNAFPFPASRVIYAGSMINNESRKALVLLKNNDKRTFYLKFQEDGNLILAAGNGTTIKDHALWLSGQTNGVRMSINNSGVFIRDVNFKALYDSKKDNTVQNAKTDGDYLTMTRAGNIVWGNTSNPYTGMFRQYYNLIINDLNYQCFNSENFTTVRSYENSNKLFSNDLNTFNILANNSNRLDERYRQLLNSIQRLPNNNYILKFQTDGNLILERNGEFLWGSETYDSSVAFLLITQNKGLELYDDTLTQQKKNWPNNNGNNLMLSPYGQLYFTNNTEYRTTLVNKPDNNPDGGQKGDQMGIFDVTANILSNVIYGGKADNLLPNSNEGDKFVKIYIENEFYDNSPWTLFVDKGGRAFKCLFDGLNQDPIREFGNGAPGSADFSGYYIKTTDDKFQVLQRDLQSVYGYNMTIENKRPVGNGDAWENYNNEENMKGFNHQQSQKALPPQFGTKDTMVDDAKIMGDAFVNYIPGYKRISSTNNEPKSFYWLVAQDNNYPAFCLFHKVTNRDAFYKDLVRYNPNLVKKIYNALGLTPGIKIVTY